MIKETIKLLAECTNPYYRKSLERELTNYQAIKILLDQKE